MKNKYRFLTVLAVTSLMIVSCDEGDAVIDDVTENTTRGAVLRTVNIESDQILLGDTDGTFAVDLEVQDIEDGDLVEAVDVFVSLADNTDANGPGDTEEQLVETIPSSSFTMGEFGFPRFSYSISFDELVSGAGVSASDVQGGDQFRVRFELVLTDGRRFSFAQNSGTLTGSFYNSPFLYSATLVCPPIEPTAGEWQLELQDSYGDSWNGASLTVTIDEESTDYVHEGGSSTSFTVDVPAGTSSIQFVYNAGSFDGENTFQVISANGETVLDLGPSPTAGEALLDFCLPLDL